MKYLLAHFYGLGSTVSGLQSHCEETVYFLPLRKSVENTIDPYKMHSDLMKGDNINKRISEKHKKINNYDREIENVEEGKKL